MKDETYLFHSDCREKKNIARSSRNKRTHNGKSGRVKFPSDYMTKKELNAMNGEVKSYRLNEPMSWKEFKALPDDIKVTYIKLLRDKYGVTDAKIAEMMGINNCSFAQEMKRLGLNTGHKKSTKWDKEGFYAWAHSVPQEAEDSIPEEPVPEFHESENEQAEEIVVQSEKCPAIPCSGNITYEGKVEDILNSIRMLLGNAKATINVYWEMKEDG